MGTLRKLSLALTFLLGTCHQTYLRHPLTLGFIPVKALKELLASTVETHLGFELWAPVLGMFCLCMHAYNFKCFVLA